MVDLSRALAAELSALGLPVFAADKGRNTKATSSPSRRRHSAAGQAASKTLRKAGFLACGVGLPIALPCRAT
ncbi:hypothetical protein MASR1M65_04380 [Saprospiraceae bacterium]